MNFNTSGATQNVMQWKAPFLSRKSAEIFEFKKAQLI